MSTQTNTCPIWGPNTIARVQYDGRNDTIVVMSRRADGYYKITQEATSMMRYDGIDDSQKARLTTMLVNRREYGEKVPMVTTERIEEAKQADPLPVPERAERLLRYLAKRSADEIGSEIPLLDVRTPAFEGALVWSESTGRREVLFLIDYLSKKGWVEIVEYQSRDAIERVAVTVDGYARIEDLRTTPDSSQAFVAMWFGDEMNDAYKKGIEPAIVQSGYKPMRIDQKTDANKLDDDIVAEIRRSRFLVADMTHGEGGARGSVYFEAGFAMGLGIQIIYTCHSDWIDKVHFDTRQYVHTL